MRFRWQNYRGYADTGLVELPAITLLIGANNAGKTSLYSPLLLLKQTIENARSDTALLSQGPLYDAGKFRDFVKNHNVDAEVIFTLGLEKTSESDVGESMIPEDLQLTFKTGDPRGDRAELGRYRLLNNEGQTLLRRQRRADGSYGLDGPLLPSEKSLGRPPGPVSKIREALRDEVPDHFLFEGSSGFIAVGDLSSGRQEHRKRIDAWLNASINLFRVHSGVNREITRILSSISYISPLRALPQRTYRLSPEDPVDVGTSGEYAPELLFRDSRGEGGGQVHLSQQVDEFIRGCGYGGVGFKSSSEGESFELSILGEGGGSANFVDSGMGLSQLLPIVTQGFLSPAGSTSIVQQPEIHLNPALQVRLMEHFVERAASGQRYLIETHSEHLLLRLRRLVAEGRLEPSSVAIFYSDKSEGNSRIRLVRLSELGGITKDDWPTGFFAEQLQDSYRLARAQSRRAKGDDGSR